MTMRPKTGKMSARWRSRSLGACLAVAMACCWADRAAAVQACFTFQDFNQQFSGTGQTFSQGDISFKVTGLDPSFTNTWENKGCLLELTNTNDSHCYGLFLKVFGQGTGYPGDAKQEVYNNCCLPANCGSPTACQSCHTETAGSCSCEEKALPQFSHAFDSSTDVVQFAVSFDGVDHSFSFSGPAGNGNPSGQDIFGIAIDHISVKEDWAGRFPLDASVNVYDDQICVQIPCTDPCSDGDPCTTGDHCEGDVCVGTPVVCDSPPSDCHQPAGTCQNGSCTYPPRPDGTSCDDLNACTQTDTCQGGVCTGVDEIVCTPQDECHLPGQCDPQTGTCSNPPQQDGTPCSVGLCMAGVCISQADAGIHPDAGPHPDSGPEPDSGQTAAVMGGCGCRTVTSRSIALPPAGLALLAALLIILLLAFIRCRIFPACDRAPRS